MLHAARRGLQWLLLAAAGLACPLALAQARADFRQELPSAQSRHVADWVLDASDHAGLPFVIVDKLQSRVWVFDGQGRLAGTAPALLGLALGDASVPGLGARPMASILPAERTTPAGRFAASLDRSLKGEEILWVDYENAIALHPVAVGVPRERRLERMASLVVSERRITYGCINVPVAFFRNVVAPLFRGRAGVVYVLPETGSAAAVFGSYDLP